MQFFLQHNINNMKKKYDYVISILKIYNIINLTSTFVEHNNTT